MVVLSLEQYEKLSDKVEGKSDEADGQGALTTQRSSHQEVFDHARKDLENEE